MTPLQVVLHPKLSILFPSSQVSEFKETIIPSPHEVVQVIGVELDPPEQYHPGSYPVQSLLQPLLSVMLLSSHISSGCFN